MCFTWKLEKNNVRLTLVILAMLSRNLVWTLEQPRESLLYRHRRFEWLINTVAWVSQLSFYMWHSNLLEYWQLICHANRKSCGSFLRSMIANSSWCNMAMAQRSQLYAIATCQRSSNCIVDHCERKKGNAVLPTPQLVAKLDLDTYLSIPNFGCQLAWRLSSPDPSLFPRTIHGWTRSPSLRWHSWAQRVTESWLKNIPYSTL